MTISYDKFLLPRSSHPGLRNDMFFMSNWYPHDIMHLKMYIILLNVNKMLMYIIMIFDLCLNKQSM